MPLNTIKKQPDENDKILTNSGWVLWKDKGNRTDIWKDGDNYVVKIDAYDKESKKLK